MAKYLPILAVSVALVGGACSRRPTWTYESQFHDAVGQADRVVVRDGGFDFDGNTDNQPVLFEVADPGEIKELYESLAFESGQERSACPCNGYPRVDWYQGGERIAVTSIQHGRAIRWIEFQGDAQLTKESAARLVPWLVEHGVDKARMELE
ncbi:MAG: hypothetical protein HQ582_07480 [Planctomycetes bacterium]|nr:hypothetical protein [Planctomycetota bacterium]